jgi:hypothetical protein
MKKPTAKQYKKIQQVAQRFLAMIYGEYKNPIKDAYPSFYYWVGKYMCQVGFRVDEKTWYCVYLGTNGEAVSVEI